MPSTDPFYLVKDDIQASVRLGTQTDKIDALLCLVVQCQRHFLFLRALSQRTCGSKL